MNTQAPADLTDCSDRNNSKYYVVVVQYTARFNAETVKAFLYALNNGKIPKKKFNCKFMQLNYVICLIKFDIRSCHYMIKLSKKGLRDVPGRELVIDHFLAKLSLQLIRIICFE